MFQGWYCDVFGECLKRLKLPHISDVDFSWIPVKTVAGIASGETVPGTNTTVKNHRVQFFLQMFNRYFPKIHISMRDPYDLLPGEDADSKLIVASWAYDGNSYPGNEYWKGSLWTSGDPQAACATQVQILLQIM